MGLVDSALRFIIRSNTREARRGFSEVKKSITGVGIAAEKTGKQGVSGFKRMSGAVIGLKNLVSGLIITFGGFQVVNAIRLWGRELVEFENEFANVTTLVDGAVTNIDGLRKGILSLGGQLGSATDLTRGLYQTLSAGVAPAEAIRFVGDSAKFARAALTDTFTAVDVLTTVINAYGLAASEATVVSDQLFEVIKQGKTTGPELAGALGRVIPTAATLNVNLKEVGAALATMTKGGVNTNESVTALNQALLSFIKPTKQAKDIAKSLGVELTADKIKADGFFKSLKELAEATQGNSTATATLFGNVRALKAVLTLTGPQASEFERILGEMQETTGNTDQAFAKISNTIGFQFKAALNNITKTLIGTSTEISFATKSIKAFNEFMENGRIPINSFTAALVGLTVALLFMGGTALVKATGSLALFNAEIILSIALMKQMTLVGKISVLWRALGASIGATVASLGFFGTIALVVGTAVAAWQVTRWISEWTGFDKVVQSVFTSLSDFEEVAAKQTISEQAATIQQSRLLFDQYGITISKVGKTQEEYRMAVFNTLRDLTQLNQMLPRNAQLWDQNEAAVAAVLDKQTFLNIAIDSISLKVAQATRDGKTWKTALEENRDAIVNVNKFLQEFGLSLDKGTQEWFPNWSNSVDQVNKRNEKLAATIVELRDKSILFGVEAEALNVLIKELSDEGGDAIEFVKRYSDELIKLGKFSAETGKDLTAFQMTLVQNAIQLEANAKASVKLTTDLLTFGTEIKATDKVFNDFVSSGKDSELLLRVFGKTLLKLGKDADAAGIALNDNTKELVENARQTDRNMDSLKRLIKEEETIEKAYKESQIALSKLTLEGVENKDFVRDMIKELVQQRNKTIDVSDAYKEADKILAEYDKELQKNARQTDKWAKEVQVADDSFEALIENMIASKEVMITANELFDELGISQDRSTTATRALVEKLVELGEKGQASARQVKEGFLIGFTEIIEASEDMPADYLAKLKQMVFDTDVQIAQKARDIWAGMIEQIKREYGTIPPEFEEINAAIRKDNERVAKDFAADWEQQISTIVTDFSGAVADIIFAGKGLGESLVDIAKEFGKGVVRTFIEQMFDPLNDLFKEFAGFLNGLFSGIGKTIGGFLKRIFSGGESVADLAGFGPARPGAAGFIGSGLLGGLGLIGGGAAAGGAIGGIGGAIIGGGIGLAGAGAAGLLGSLGAFGAFAGPIGVAIAGITAAVLGFKDLFTNTPVEAGQKETRRDFGVGIDENIIRDFLPGIGLDQKSFAGIRKDVLSSGKFLEDILIPAAQANGSIETLIASFGKLEAFGQTFDLSAPLREAVESGDFTNFNAAWFEIFKNSKALVAVFGNEIPTALFGTQKSVEEVVEELENLVDTTGLTAEFADSFVEGFVSIQGAMENIDQASANLSGRFEGMMDFLTDNGLSALEAQNLAWEELGGSLIDTFNEMNKFGIEIPPFIQQLIDWGVENEKVAMTTDGIARAMDFAETSAGKLLDRFSILVDELRSTGVISGELAKIISGAGVDLREFQLAAKIGGLQQFQGEILSLKAAIEALIPKQKTWQETFLETGLITDDISEKIRAAGGDIQTFNDFSDVKRIRDGFEALVAEMEETGTVSAELIKRIAQFGGSRVQASMESLLGFIEASGAKFIELGSTSQETQNLIRRGVEQTGAVLTDEFTVAAQALSDELGNINDALIVAIETMTEALLDAIADVVAAITGIPKKVDIEVVTTHSDVFDNVEDLARNRGISPEEAERLLNDPEFRRSQLTEADIVALMQSRGVNRDEAVRLLLDPTFTAFQHGGIVRKPTLSLLGEAGPEAVIPLDRFSSFNRGNQNEQPQVTVIFEDGAINLSNLDSSGLEEMVQERLVPMITDSITRNIGGGGDSFKDSLDI